MGELAVASAPLVEHLWRNCKAAGLANEYGDIEYGERLGTRRFEIVAGKDAVVYRYRFAEPDSQTVYEGGFLRGPEALYKLRRDSSDRPFAINNHVVPWHSPGDNNLCNSQVLFSPIGHFIQRSCGLANGGRHHPVDDPDLKRSTVAPGSYNGKPTLTVKVTFGPESHRTDHLDPKTLLVVATERVGKLDVKTRKVLPIRMVNEMTYGPPSENGLPFPKAVKGWFIMPDGARHPMTDVEFTEYRRYTPKADELDLEKQFGVKPLPPGTRFVPPTSVETGAKARSLSRWLLAGAGALAVAAGGLVFYTRRRRRAGTVTSP